MPDLHAHQMQQVLLQSKFIPVLAHPDAEVCIRILQACYKAGVRVFEFTDRNDNSFEIYKKLRQYRDLHLPGMYLGVGTIKTARRAGQFLEGKADFLVSPLTLAEIQFVSEKYQCLWIPGCATPSEIGVAEKAGISLVKIFPAKQLGGPAYIQAVKEVFPSMRFMATGGVEADKENMQKWFQAGVSIVGIGSCLFTKKILEEKTYDILQKKLEEIKMAFASVEESRSDAGLYA